MKTIKLKILKGWRVGQTIFNFLEWCNKKGYLLINQMGERCGDPFYVEDCLLNEYWDEFLNEYK